MGRIEVRLFGRSCCIGEKCRCSICLASVRKMAFLRLKVTRRSLLFKTATCSKRISLRVRRKGDDRNVGYADSRNYTFNKDLKKGSRDRYFPRKRIVLVSFDNITLRSLPFPSCSSFFCPMKATIRKKCCHDILMRANM